jgi:cytochrome c peroxidase
MYYVGNAVAGNVAADNAQADDQMSYAIENYRDEPISPIPQTVTVDTAKAQLGKTLFSDKRLSKDHTISCADCHQLSAGGDDNVAKGISSTFDINVMNTPSIFNARYNFRQNWDGSARTLNQQIDMVVKNHHEFNNDWKNIILALSSDTTLKKDFETVYVDGLSKDNIIDAIVEFEKTLITPNSKFDRYLRNENVTLTDDELAGYALFKELGCISCHQGRNIGGNLFQKFGIFYDYIGERGDITKEDYGKFNTTNRQMDKFVFKVPSLRNIALTAPYLHDGSAETLDEAVLIMGKTQLGKVLTQKEVYLIISFLKTLTGEYEDKIIDDSSTDNAGMDKITIDGTATDKTTQKKPDRDSKIQGKN